MLLLGLHGTVAATWIVGKSPEILNLDSQGGGGGSADSVGLDCSVPHPTLIPRLPPNF